LRRRNLPFVPDMLMTQRLTIPGLLLSLAAAAPAARSHGST